MVTPSSSSEVDERTNDRESRIAANVILDGGQDLRAGHHDLPNMGADIGTPSACAPGSPRTSTSRSSQGAAPGDTTATIKVFIKPMILWLWIGGAIMAVGTLLAAFPGSRRRIAIDPVSAPIAVDGPPTDDSSDDSTGASSVGSTEDASEDDVDTRTGAPV